MAKRLNTKILNGRFQFYIDGIDQHIISDQLLTADNWYDVSKSVVPGHHVFEWKFSKFVNIGRTFSTGDVMAEISYVKVEGVSYAPRECKKCLDGVPNQEQNRCKQCGTNEYLVEDLAAQKS